MAVIPQNIWNSQKWNRFKKNWKKRFAPGITIMILLIFSIIFGANIAYSLQNFISTKYLKINTCQPPFSNPPSFPYNLCPEGAVHVTDLTNPCFAPLTWFAQTIGFSWSRWRKMILRTKKDDLAVDELPYKEIFKNIKPGTIKEFILFLILPLGVFLIMTIGPIISIIITYCSSFSAYRGMLLTFIFTFFFPILLTLIAPLLALFQPLEVLYITTFKPLISGGGLSNLMDKFMRFAFIPLLCFPLILLMWGDVLGWPLGAPLTIGLLAFYLKQLFS